MKKVLCFILVLIMCLSLCACNHEAETADETDNSISSSEQNGDDSANTVPTKDEMLAVASELDLSELYTQTESNIVKAKSEYCNKTFQCSRFITEIEENCILLSDGWCYLKVYLPLEDILQLENGQYVTIVGQMSDNIEQEKDTYGLTEYQYSMNAAYLVSSTYTKIGKYHAYHSTDGTHPQGLCIECTNDSGKSYYIELVNDTEQNYALPDGAEITVEGKIFVNDNDMPHSADNKIVATNIVPAYLCGYDVDTASSEELYYALAEALSDEGYYTYAIQNYEKAGNYADSSKKITELESFKYLQQVDSSDAAKDYFTENLEKYPALSGDEIRALLLNNQWLGFSTGRVWTFFEDGSIDDNWYYESGFQRSWRIDGDLLTYSGNTINGEVFNSYSVHKAAEDTYLLAIDGEVRCSMVQVTE